MLGLPVMDSSTRWPIPPHPLVFFQSQYWAWFASHFFPCDPFVLRFWEQGPNDQRAIKVVLLRENDYVERSFEGNYNSVLAIGQKAQANPAILVGDRRMQQLVSGI
jgi:hypothetical protein